MPEKTGQTPGPRQFGRFNGLGCWSYCKRGVIRLMRWSLATLGGTCVSSGLLLAVFVLAGRDVNMAAGLSTASFIAPGIVLFASAYSAFEGGAVLVLEDKIEGTISDVLMAPLSALEIVAGMVVPALLNALAAAFLVFALSFFFTDYSLPAPGLALTFLVLNVLVFSLFGALIGLWAEKWDHFGGAQAFFMLPLGFISGAFFSIDALPELGRILLQLNPLYHAVAGVRLGLTGHGTGEPLVSILVLSGLSATLAVILWRLVVSGYKVRP
ncbi:MAG: ABC transporter permease [Kiloniellales bacterium]|nr:ABC transporter permease [Kiloniellales bacterium]